MTGTPAATSAALSGLSDDERRDFGLAQDVAQARGGMQGIQGHVGTACLEHGDHRDQHVERSLDGHADEPAALVRPGDPLAQEVGHLIGAPVERLIGEGGAQVLGRHRLRGRLRLQFDQFMDAALLRIVEGRGVDAMHQPFPLGRRHARSGAEGLHRIGGDGLQQGLITIEPVRHRGLIEQVGVVVAIHAQTVGGFDDVQEEIEVDVGLGVGRHLHRQPGQFDPVGKPFQIELNLGQRQPSRLARHRELPHQGSERVVLVFIHVEHALGGGREELRDSRVALPAAADRKKVDAMADQDLILEQRLPGGRYSDHHLVLVRKTPHERLEGRQQGDEQGAALAGAGLLHRLIELGIDAAAQARPLEGLDGGPGPIGGQLERSSGVPRTGPSKSVRSSRVPPGRARPASARTR